MKRIFIVIVLLTVISNYSMATTEDNLHWFKDAKFGLFIHWGLYSQTADILRKPIPLSVTDFQRIMRSGAVRFTRKAHQLARFIRSEV